MITAKNVSLFKKSLEGISSLIQETNVRFKDDGIYIKAIDKTQILLIDFYFPKYFFENYSVDPSLVGLNIQEVYNMLSRSFEKDKLKLELKENSLQINLLGAIQRKFNTSFIDISDSDISIPEINYESIITVPAYFLKEILKDVSLISSTLTLKLVDNKLIIESFGEKGDIEVSVLKAKVKSKKNVCVKFSLAYLKNITKSIDNDCEIILKLKDDSPLFLEYNIEKDIKIKFYLSCMLF
ncbi:MAG: hypothetical protein PHR26_00225 [Candidatus ainarchaeum sp.]|nr:hypothetical protein [Candidatus ainarchaeum sp.]MDD3975641.1 hypothetical protein [Candidatus ainarchaeum sp.]